MKPLSAQKQLFFDPEAFSVLSETDGSSLDSLIAVVGISASGRAESSYLLIPLAEQKQRSYPMHSGLKFWQGDICR